MEAHSGYFNQGETELEKMGRNVGQLKRSKDAFCGIELKHELIREM